MKKILTLLCVSAVLFAGCSKDHNDPVVEFNLDWPENIAFESGETLSFGYTTNYDLQFDFIHPVGWAMEESEGKIVVTAPYATDGSAETSGMIEVFVTAFPERNPVRYAAEVSVVPIVLTLTFEDVPGEYLAGPTAKGENLYSEYEGTQYIGYSDTNTGLQWQINEAYGSREFWNGGVAISQWTDKTGKSWENQCSVYGEGGTDGSATFAVANGGGAVYFSDEAAEGIFESFWVSNTTYATLVMEEGNDFAKKFSYDDQDWFKLIVTGYNAEGAATGTVEYYLADFRTDGSPGIVEGWNKVDLSSLGKVNKIAFSFDSTDVDPEHPEWGISTPAYFCFDDLVIKK